MLGEHSSVRLDTDLRSARGSTYARRCGLVKRRPAGLYVLPPVDAVQTRRYRVEDMTFLAALLITFAPADGSVWDRLAECESGGDWDYNGGSGYDGGIQFLPATWSSMNPPTEYAWQATREQQIAVGRELWEIQGWGAWPGCADKLGLWGTDPSAGPSGQLPMTR